MKFVDRFTAVIFIAAALFLIYFIVTAVAYYLDGPHC